MKTILLLICFASFVALSSAAEQAKTVEHVKTPQRLNVGETPKTVEDIKDVQNSNAVDRPKALMIVPGNSRSQIIFYETVAKILNENGFEVTQLILAVSIQARAYVAPVGTHAIVVDVDPDRAFEKMESIQNKMAFEAEYMSPGMARAMVGMLASFTERMLEHQDVLSQLKAQKFDIGYGYMYSYGSAGILEAVGIKSTVFLPSGNLVDPFYWYMGCPVPWSYVPSSISAFSDQMTFRQRAASALMQLVYIHIYTGHLLPEENMVFRKAYGPDFPDLRKLVSNYQLTMVNNDELIDLPRPILHKIIYIAGLGMSANEQKPVPKVSPDMFRILGRFRIFLLELGSNL